MRQDFKSYNQKKRYKEWIWSYLIVLVIPILICAIFYMYAFYSVWMDTQESNKVALSLAADELDDIFARSLLLEYNIQNNESLLAVSKLNGLDEKHERNIVINAMKDCDSYKVWDDAIESYYICFPKSEIIIFTNGYMRFERSFEYVGNEYGLSEEAWYEVLRGKHDRHFLINESEQKISYITSLPLNGGEVKINALLVLDKSYMQKIMSCMDHMKGSGIMIIDDTGEVLMSRNYTIDVVDDIDIIVQEAGYHSVDINQQKMLVSTLASKYVDLKYVSVIPYREFWGKALGNLYTFVYALLICIFVGVAVAWIIARIKSSTYGQFSYLVEQRINKRKGSVYWGNHKEIGIAIKDILNEYEQMRKEIQVMGDRKRKLILSSILTGRIRRDDISQAIMTNDVSFEYGKYILVTFRLSKMENVFGMHNVSITEDETKVLENAVKSVITEVLEGDTHYEIISLNEHLILLVDLGKAEEKDCIEKVEVFTLRASETLKDLNDILSIAVSNVHSGIESLRKAYVEAINVMEYQSAMGSEEIISYKDIFEKADSLYLFSTEKEAELINYLNSGRSKEALSMIKEIYETNVLGHNGGKELRVCLLWDIVACVLKFENNVKGKLELADTINWLEKMGDDPNANRNWKLLEKRIVEICTEVLNIRDNKDNSLAKRIQEYICQNYHNSNLSGREIAGHFYMNVTYLSTFFKEKTGMNLLWYIHQVRIEKAKELLEQTTMTVEQVSQAVGCNNGNSLMRLFKKYEGISPTAWREKVREK